MTLTGVVLPGDRRRGDDLTWTPKPRAFLENLRSVLARYVAILTLRWPHGTETGEGDSPQSSRLFVKRWVDDPQRPVHLRTPRHLRRRLAVPSPRRSTPGFYEWLAAAPTGAEAQAAGDHACGTGSCSALTGWSPATVNALSGLSWALWCSRRMRAGVSRPGLVAAFSQGRRRSSMRSRASRSWVWAAMMSQVHRSAASGVRRRGLVQPRVCLKNRCAQDRSGAGTSATTCPRRRLRRRCRRTTATTVSVCHHRAAGRPVTGSPCPR